MTIKYRAGYKYQLVEPYVCQTAITPPVHVAHDYLVLKTDGVLIINAGYAWDGASGPTVDTKSFMRGSLVHDALYQLMREGLIDLSWRNAADQELRRLCVEDGMSCMRAWWVYRAVNNCGEGSAKPQQEIILEAP